jgi:HK97 family phage portal protein
MAYMPKGIFEQSEEGKQLQAAHPVHELISSAPNSYETAFQFWARLFTSSLCYGRGVALIDRDSFTGYPKAMHVVHPRQMRMLDMDGAMLVEIDGKTYSWNDVLVVSELQGRSPIDLHRDNLNLAKDVENYGSEFFEGGHLLGVLSADGPLTNDQLRDLQRAWNTTEKRGTKILPQGMKYQSISLPPEQTSFLSTRRYQDETICTIFGVPPNVVGVSTKETKANSEEQGRNFVRMTLLPRAVQLEQEIARKLLPALERGQLTCSIDLRELQRGDTAARSQYLSTLLRDGVITRNEARRAEGFNQRQEPGADQLLVQVNNIALDRIDDYSAKISESNA